jgi:Tat protein secretion system quality control protein TatD with DNase activity
MIICRSKIIGGGVVHSYTDSLEEMKELIDLDLYIGMICIVVYVYC